MRMNAEVWTLYEFCEVVRRSGELYSFGAEFDVDMGFSLCGLTIALIAWMLECIEKSVSLSFGAVSVDVAESIVHQFNSSMGIKGTENGWKSFRFLFHAFHRTIVIFRLESLMRQCVGKALKRH